MTLRERMQLAGRNLQQPAMQPKLAGLVIVLYVMLLQLPTSLRLGGLRADLASALLGLPPLGWAASVLLRVVYDRTERIGLALPATLLCMAGGFAAVLWMLVIVLLRGA